jgi:hypothetical protein
MTSQQTKVIGTKTQEAIEAEWVADFRQSGSRPEGKGWLTVVEMAAVAGCGVTAMRVFISRQPAGYWSTCTGRVRGLSGRPRAATFYRKAGSSRRRDE